MTAIQSLFEQAQLAEAAYADLTGAVGNQSALITRLDVANKNTYNGSFSLAQATEFVKHWRVADQYIAPAGLYGLTDGTGFSATLFESLDHPGQYSLALRGTQPGYSDLAADAGDVLTDGVALDQIVDLYNYWQSLTHTGVYQAKQLTTLTTETAALIAAYLVSPATGLAYEATLRADGNIVIDNPPHTVRTIQTVSSSQLSDSGLQLGSGKLPGTAVVNVDGHSLGGHLAMAFSRLFPNATNSVTAVNGAGFDFDNSNVDHLFAMLGGASGFDASKITNVVGSAAMNLVSQDWLFLQQPVGRNEIYTESYSLDNVVGHGASQMTDSLALYNLFATLDPSLNTTDPADGIGKITGILKAESNVAATSLENTLDALRTLFEQNYAGSNSNLTAPSTATDNREKFYTHFNSLTAWLGNSPFTSFSIDTLTDKTAVTLFSQSQANTPDGLATRYALYKGNAFVVKGASALYDAINSDGALSLYDPATHTGNLTGKYLADRSNYLVNLLARNTQDSTDTIFSSAGGDVLYRDYRNGQITEIRTGSAVAGDNARQHIVFGSEQSDTLFGGSKPDHLYGLGGDDTLNGGDGDDYLEGNEGDDLLYGSFGNDTLLGGKGFDIYRVYAGDGFDTVLDTDGQGIVKIDGIEATGSAGIDLSNWKQLSADSWADIQNGIVYIRRVVNEETQLVIHKGDSNVLVKGWSAGELGIELGAGSTPVAAPTPAIDLTLAGDLRPVDIDLQTAGVQTGTDDLGNVIVSGEADPGREDILYDSAGNDLIQSLGGNDYIDAWRGGDDRIEGGAGQDLINGGAGNDLLLGGTDSDVITGGADSDRLYADIEYTPDAAYTLGETQAASGQRGDLLDGGTGDDSLIGDGGNDILMGGLGQDVLVGMGGDDTIEGDANVETADRNWSVTRTATTESDSTRYSRSYSFFTAGTEAMAAGDADVIYGGAGNDWIFAGGGNDFVDGGADDDVVFGGSGNDIILGQGGNDVLTGDSWHPDLDASLHGDDYLSGGAGNDKLWGAGGADFLEGGDGDDVLMGDGENVPAEYEGDDLLDGGAGNDALYGGGGNDVLIGGAGNDTLFGDKGDDIYLDVDAGDVIGDLAGHSTIVLAHATSASPEVPPSVAPTSDSTLGIALDDGSTLNLQGALYGMDATIQFANGEEFDLETWVSEKLTQSVTLNLNNMQLGSGEPVRRAYGGAGADQIQGSTGADSLKGYGGDDLVLGMAGNDVLDGGAGNDHLQGDEGDDTLYGSEGTDTLLGGDGNDTLLGGVGNDELQGGLGDDVLEGGSGDDTLFGQEGSDTLYGGEGNDTLVGNAGNDVYLFNLGGSQDVIWEEGDSAGDVLRFGTGIAPSDILVARAGYNQVLFHANGVDQVTISNWYTGVTYQLARFEFADGTIWNEGNMGNSSMLLRGTSSDDASYGGYLDDLLVGLDGNDQLYGNGGNDTLVGGKGNDALTGGSGADTYVFSKGDGADVVDSDTADTLRFAANISSTDISAERVGADLFLRHQNGTDSVRILNWYGNTNDQLEQVAFNSDGTTWSASTVSLMGVSYGNRYTFNLGDGAKVIEDWGGVDSLTFGVGIAASDIAVVRVGEDLRLSHVNGSDQATVKSWFTYADGSAWVEEIRFADGTVWSAEALTSQALTQVGTDGDDYLQGINNFGDTLRGGDGNDGLYGNSGDDILEGGSGIDTLWGGDGNDTLVAGPDGGYANGEAGDDLYLYSAGDGDLSIGDSGGSDTLRFGAGIQVSDVQFQRQYSDLNVTLADGGRIRINYWFNGYDRLVERFEFADGTVVTAEQLNPPLLVQEGTSGSDVLYGTGLADTLIGAAGDDMLYGYDGNDLLLGDQGHDQLYSGNGDDCVYGGEGYDQLYGEGGDDCLYGGEGHDRLYGEAGNDDLNGGAGNDYLDGGDADDSYRDLGLGQDTILDSAGLDSLYFASDILSGQVALARVNADLRINFTGREDSVTLLEWFRQPGNSIERFIFADGSEWSATDIAASFNSITGSGTLVGSVGDDLLYGGSGADTLQGDAGNDLLDGGSGADNLSGGTGDDVYIADASDSIVELAGEGIDTLVWTGSADIVLQNELENLVLAESTAYRLYRATGNTANNWIIGNSQPNILDGEAGADTLQGGLDDDTYYVDDPGDVVIEQANEGDDIVRASITYTLAEQVETLVLTGSAAINGFGNELGNVLQGNDAINMLAGGAGNDQLTGGLGADTLIGGSGDDSYYLDGYDDILIEGNDEGYDRILITQVSEQKGNTGYWASFAMADNIESLQMTNYVTDATLYGNALDNVIDARGTKVFDHQSGNVTWYYLANVDIYGGAGNDVIYSSDGGNLLDGGLGDDLMVGGYGGDTYYVDSELDEVVENTASGTDSVYSTVSYILGTNIENLYLLGSANINGTGNDQNNRLYGNSANNVLTGGAGNDRLDSGGGNDTLIGGVGDDTYVVSASDLIIEQANEGIDMVEASISYSLGANLESLTLIGSAVIDGTGNGLANLIKGNSANNRLAGGAGNDTLDGKGGNDTMLGGSGDDSYYVDSTKDVVAEYADEGVDTIYSNITYTLGNDLENLTLIGSSAISGTGNALNNQLLGNAANNTLTGGAGNDWLDGSGGVDTLAGGTGNDTYIMGRGYGVDTVVENDTLAGNTDIAQFLSGVAADQIWFKKSSNNLEVSIIGTTDTLVIKNWYRGDACHVEQFKTTEGAQTLLDSDVQNLVNAMASFAPPAAGQITLPQNYQDALAGVIAANWQ